MIRGYPETPSRLPGETLALCVSTDHPRFRVDFYRQGESLNLVGSAEWADGHSFARGSPDQDWGWRRHEFAIPDDWPSGTYVAMFFELDDQGNEISAPADTSVADGREAKALFVVRSAMPGQSARILYKLPLFTYHAYNETSPGGSLYTGSRKVTMRRTGGGTGGTPWDNFVTDAYDNTSPRQTFAHWDVPFIRWLEKNGYSVDYCTDLDIHENPNGFLASYRLLLSVGHDEYWSEQVRSNVEEFIENGGNVAFFSGNTCWWRVHLEDNDTALSCDKSKHPGDSEAFDQWLNTYPETNLTGVTYRHAGGWWDGTRDSVGYTVQRANHWVYEGTALQDGAIFGDKAEEALVGYECDGALLSGKADAQGFVVPSFSDGTPPSFTILGVGRLGPNWKDRESGPNAAATLGIYTRTGIVFTAATTDWARVLASGQNAHVERITKNVLDRLTSRGCESSAASGRSRRHGGPSQLGAPPKDKLYGTGDRETSASQ